MSTGEIYLLGAIAGVTIFIGLPVGRIRGMSKGVAAFINAAAAGVLVFLLVETTEHAFAPVEHALEEVTLESGGTWGDFVLKASLFTLALGVGLLGLVYYERWMNDRRARSAASTQSAGSGAAAAEGLDSSRGLRGMTDAHHLAFLIAVGIGLHNFAEGLAIGQSAASDEISFAVLLVIGFAVHNATEGFGIVAPMAAEDERPRWAYLGLLGLIAGGPTFLGTVIGQSFVDETVNIVFLALAAGSILYVIVQLLNVALKLGHREMLMWGLFVGLLFGLGTELVLVAAGL
ncbi:MAG TPA: ZIP family metal transporter [Acidimicrobiia bacterium]|nr:ZIP family metal transporter [Acidimicrobiia bacterium]